LNYIQTNKQVT